MTASDAQHGGRWGPRPWSAFLGPIVQREMRVAGRKKRTYFARGAVMLLLVLFAFIAALSAITEYRYASSGVAATQATQAVAPRVALVVLWVEYIALVVLAPLLTATAIYDERRSETLPALLTTPLSAAEIVVGKLVSRLSTLFMLGLLAVPLLLAMRIFGGVSLSLTLHSFGLLFMSAFMAASVGLLVSVDTKSSVGAVSGAVLLTALLFAVPVLGLISFFHVWQNVFPGSTLRPHPWMPMVVCPPIAFGFTTAELSGATGMFMPRYALVSMGYGLVVGTAITLLTIARFRRAVRKAYIDAPKGRREKRSRHAPASRAVSNRPVLWRELRGGSGMSWIVRVVLVAFAFVGIGGLYLRFSISSDEAQAIPLMVGIVLVLIQACILTTGSFASERDAATWDALLTTDLRPSEIVLGKVAGALRRQVLIPSILAVHMVISVLAGAMHWSALIFFPLIFGASVLLLTGTGTWFGLRLRKATTAGAFNLGFAITIWAGIPIVVTLAIEVLDRTFDLDWIIDLLVMSNPVVLAGVIGSELEEKDRIRDMLFHWPSGARNFGEMLFVVSVVATLAVGLGTAAVAHSIYRFNRIVGRSG